MIVIAGSYPLDFVKFENYYLLMWKKRSLGQARPCSLLLKPRLNIVKEIAYCFQESSEAISLTMFSLTKARPVAWSGFSPRLKQPQKNRISQKTSKKRTKTGKKRIFYFKFFNKVRSVPDLNFQFALAYYSKSK